MDLNLVPEESAVDIFHSIVSYSVLQHSSFLYEEISTDQFFNKTFLRIRIWSSVNKVYKRAGKMCMAPGQGAAQVWKMVCCTKELCTTEGVSTLSVKGCICMWTTEDKLTILVTNYYVCVCFQSYFPVFVNNSFYSKARKSLSNCMGYRT